MKRIWKRTFIILLDVVLGIYIVLAFTAFNKPDETKKKCTKVNISIADESNNGFITVAEIKKRLVAGGIYPKGQPLRYVDARKIEDRLKMSPFVKTAECYKTQDGQVFINITQLLPVIRIKADNGDDYYVDDKNSVMPNSSYVSNLIIASGNITPSFATNYISPMGKALMANDVWCNLIEQIHVLPGGGVELVPRVGDHIVYIGRLPEFQKNVSHEKLISDFVGRKMTRLVKFYKYGLSYAGWNKYSYINLEFDNQIICKKRSHKAVVHNPQPTPQTVETQSSAASEKPATDQQNKQQKQQQTEQKKKTL